MDKRIALGAALWMLLITQSSIAQNRKWLFGLEAGGSIFGNDVSRKPYIRNEQQNDFRHELAGKFNLIWGGTKIETQKGKWSFGSGLNYLQTSSSIAANGDAGYYYVLYKTPDNSVEYLRTRELAQSASYLAIPLEVKFFPFAMDNSFKVYFSASAQMGFLLNFKNSISANAPDKDLQAVDVYALLEKPGGTISTMNFGGGVQWTRPSGLICTLGVIVPASFATSGTQAVNPNSGAGIYLRVQVPMSKYE